MQLFNYNVSDAVLLREVKARSKCPTTRNRSTFYLEENTENYYLKKDYKYAVEEYMLTFQKYYILF